MIAKVLVDVPAKAVDRLFDYAVPDALAPVLEPGMRVVVPFGSRELMGFCLALSETADHEGELKPVLRVLDIEPYLTEELIGVARQIAIETAVVLIRVLEMILPSAMRAVYETKVQIVDPRGLPPALADRFNDAGELTLDAKTDIREIKRELQNGRLRQIYAVQSKAKARFENWIAIQGSERAPSSEKQKAILRTLLAVEAKAMPQKALLEASGGTPAILKTMLKNGLIRTEHRESYREVADIHPLRDKTVALNDEQSLAYQAICQAPNTHRVFLLHGVTGSGKTEIYLKAIETVLLSGKEAIFLVPEIALTPQMVSRFKGRFGDDVAILHSGLSVGEKYDEWRKIIRKEVKIAVGARSAVFAPFEHLGLIVIDECHESSYKQEDNPRYHAIDVAIRRAMRGGYPVVLGSATPNIETYARAKKGHFTLLELKHRYGVAEVPVCELIDMREEFKAGNGSLFSRRLVEAIADRLAKKEQIILLINRRGYASFVLCRSCGHVVMCPSCDVSLTYHETERTLKCHYCGHKETPPAKCPKCGGEHLRFMGIGSQKIESELAERFPEARIVRMDNDTTRTKNAHALLLREFEEDADILLGTQMIAKGLDYPNVTLVGIIAADLSLYHPDFRSPERTFQLLTQVAGRAGRHERKGEVVIQAHNPDHYAIRFAVAGDYEGFYQHEMRLRKLARYVPFYYMAELSLQGDSLRDLLIRGKDIVKTLRTQLTEEAIVLGPHIPEIARIKNKYQVIMTVKYRIEPALDGLLAKIRELYESDTIYLSVDRSSTLA
jgi:primosomal protein N' (replication factor Y)